MKTTLLFLVFTLLSLISGCRQGEGTSWQYFVMLDMRIMGKSFSRLSFDECKNIVTLPDLLSISQKKGFIHPKDAKKMECDEFDRPYLFERIPTRDHVVFRIACLKEGEQEKTPDNVACLCEVTIPRTGSGSFKLIREGRDVTPK
jgi:hypothetical protein